MKYFKKLIEPIFEFEKRRDRLVLYLFENQIININTYKFKRLLLSLRYTIILNKLRLKLKFKKIKVAFLVTDITKWTCRNLYEELENSKYFDPIIYISLFRQKSEFGNSLEKYRECIEYFKKHNMKYELVYDEKEKTYISLKKFKPDILFYQQPWGNAYNQNIDIISKFALCAYVPYCFYSMSSYFDYLRGFHGKLWRYFVESEFHKKEYEKKYEGFNCIATGSLKLDNYKYIDMAKINSIKNNNKKTIIYAPHHSFEKGVDYAMATFEENGKLILEFAKKHPEIQWIFRPHGVFKDKLLQYNIMAENEIEKYYKEWEKIGRISKPQDNYYEEFMLSDCLITDCISFLAEYLPTKKPVIHLRSKNQRFAFNDLLKEIIKGYYQVYSNEELNMVLEEIIIKNNDYLKEERCAKIQYITDNKNETAGKIIRKYLENVLGVNSGS